MLSVFTPIGDSSFHFYMVDNYCQRVWQHWHEMIVLNYLLHVHHRQSSLSYPSMVFGSTFINACILKIYIADNQSVVITKSLSTLGPVDMYWWVAPLNQQCVAKAEFNAMERFLSSGLGWGGTKKLKRESFSRLGIFQVRIPSENIDMMWDSVRR